MAILFAFVATFVLGSLLNTFVVFRILRVELSVGRFWGAFLAAAVLGIAVASIVDWTLLRTECRSGEPCGYPGSNEGGGIVATMMLFICYCVTYTAAAVAIARFYSRRPIRR
jgi:hypothetical protein